MLLLRVQVLLKGYLLQQAGWKTPGYAYSKEAYISDASSTYRPRHKMVWYMQSCHFSVIVRTLQRFHMCCTSNK